MRILPVSPEPREEPHHGTWRKAAGAVVLAVVAGACGADREEASRVDGADTAPGVVDTAVAAADTAGAASLLGIMRGIQANMDRVDHALWVERLDSLAVAARAVADHPKVGPEERARILGTLGERAPAFQQADMRVHDEAVRLSEAAAAADMEAVLASLSRLQEACVACHTEFREALRTARGTSDR